MSCPKCGEPSDNKYAFCLNCGAQLDESSDSSASRWQMTSDSQTVLAHGRPLIQENKSEWAAKTLDLSMPPPVSTSRKGPSYKWLIMVILIIGGILALVFGLMSGKSTKKAKGGARVTPPAIRPGVSSVTRSEAATARAIALPAPILQRKSRPIRKRVRQARIAKKTRLLVKRWEKKRILPRRQVVRQSARALQPAFVTIESVPSGATLYLDLKPRGTTPKRAVELMPGRHRATFIMQGYKTQSKRFRVRSGKDMTIRAIMEKRI